ncbi:MAG TPA: hypothetical protein VFN57_00805 [Thermomicrobiaceae bacterium]|nr:hypothetical protein [Thermomicrobiaceae bacterium]
MARDPDVPHEPDEVRRIVLSVLGDCAQCHRPHDLEDLRVVGRNGNLWVLAVRCGGCGTRAFVAAVVGDYGIDIAEAEAGEWDVVDVDEILEAEPVGVDDVLDMHEFLESFDGDFQSLFTRRRR